MITNPVKLNTFNEIYSANLCKAKLNLHNIESNLTDENSASIQFGAGIMIGVSIFVNKKDLNQAMTILQNIDNEEGEPIEVDELKIDEEQIRCPECGSVNFYFKKFKFSLLPPFIKIVDEYICWKCDTRWQEK